MKIYELAPNKGARKARKRVGRGVGCGKGKTNYRRFIDAIRTGAPASPDFADGLRIQTLLERCVRASRTNREITV